MHVKDGVEGANKDGENNSNSQNEPDVDEAYEIEKKLLKLIKADTKNEKMWNDLKEAKLRKDLWYEKVREDFSCFRCYELILFPVTLPCNHNCCKKCLLKSMDEGHKECWLCRFKLEGKEEDEDYKKFNVDEHFNNEMHAIMKYLFPGLMGNEEEAVKKAEKIVKGGRKRKIVEDENSNNAQEVSKKFQKSIILV